MSYFPELSNEEKSRLLAKFGRTRETFHADVEVVKDWFSKQKHLPEIPCDERINVFLFNARCQIEENKRRWDLYYSVRMKLPEFFLNPNQEPMKSHLDCLHYVPVPRLTTDGGRITVIKLVNPDVFNPVLMFAWILNVIEIMMLESFSYELIFVNDCTGISFGNLIKTSPIVIKKVTTILNKVHKSSIRGIHFLNAPPFIDKMLQIVKSVVKEKIEGRIHVHQSLSSLHEHVPKELLPSDYGGNEKSMVELHGMLKQKVVQYKDYYDRMDTWEVNEHLRPGPPPMDDDELFGSYGNFKQLDLD